MSISQFFAWDTELCLGVKYASQAGIACMHAWMELLSTVLYDYFMQRYI